RTCDSAHAGAGFRHANNTKTRPSDEIPTVVDLDGDDRLECHLVLKPVPCVSAETEIVPNLNLKQISEWILQLFRQLPVVRSTPLLVVACLLCTALG
ncbi:MAG: hypothetical protein ACHQWV_05300, partial [Nitrospirales bacterium]